jgi:phosphonate transport system ATP-binding protein
MKPVAFSAHAIEPALTIEKLTRSFGALKAVDDVSLAVGQGQMVGIIGRSGAGKSTLLRLVNRLIEPTSGRIVASGQDVTALGGRQLLQWRADCAMIFQHFNLVSRLDVLTNVMLGGLRQKSSAASLVKWFSAEERARALRALERVDLVPQALKRADMLSGGQQQRVAIARALMQKPRIILADEPIASLDPRNAQRVMSTLRGINRADGITVLCNLHTLDTARQFCDRIVGMAEGRVVFDGSPDQLTPQVLRDVYQHDDEIDESLTSTSIPVLPPIQVVAPQRERVSA